jgi:CHAT domain-containing protein
LNNLGGVYLRLGDYPKAIEYYQQCLVIAREIRNYEQSLAIAREREDYQSWATDLHKLIALINPTGPNQLSLWLARQAEGVALGNLAIAYLGLGDYPKAIDYTQQSLVIAKDIKDRNGEGLALANLGLAYLSLGDYAKAIEYHQQSLAIVLEVKDRQSEGTVLSYLGDALRKSGNLAAAEKTLNDGIKIWESLRASLDGNDANKVSIFETQANTYRLLQEVLIAQNKTDAALEIAERGRARALVELLARRLYANPTEQPPSTPPNIDQIKQIAKAQNSTLVQYSIIYDEFKVQGKQQSKESELYIWVIKPTSEVTFRKTDLKSLWQKQNTTLADLVYISRDSLGVRDFPIIGLRPRPGAVQKQEASLTEQLQQLHKLLIEPIADLLPTDVGDHVVFIPQGELFLVPFGALKDKDGKYLIEKHTILTAPSIEVLDLTRQQRQRVGAQGLAPLQGNDAIVVGNPTMPSVPPEPGQPAQPLPSLPGSEQEANAIAPLLNTKPLIGNQATKSAIKQLMPKARIIHLATHGLLDDVRGLGSAIALAPDSPSSVPTVTKGGIGGVDGLLTAEEILDMKLNAELAVLSACNTGRGKLTGDGIIGLSRSLIAAGVPSVLVSLWAVPDAPTASLMTEFYQNLQKNPDKAQALRQAMLTTMKQHPNPKNWAAFTLIGEAE